MAVRSRSVELDLVITRARQAFFASTQRPAAAQPVAERIFAALREVGESDSSPASQPITLDVCEHLDSALAGARQGPECVAQLADAFAAVLPQLAWGRRPGSATDAFYKGHANAMLVGPRGMERRHDVRCGASLVAPGVRYPDHRHPPEEIYVVLTPGQWRQQEKPWHEPGPGGVVHNPANIVHAMRAGDAPLLALWFLWVGHG